MSRWSRSVVWAGVAGSAVALATLIGVLLLADPLGGGSARSGSLVLAGGLPAAVPSPRAQVVGDIDTGPGWRVSLRPGSTVDLDTGVVVERSDSLALGADLIFDAGMRLATVPAVGGSPGGARLTVLDGVSAWPDACSLPAGLAGYVDARRLRRGSALCARTSAGRVLLLVVEAQPTVSKPRLALELRRAG
jgi:hypothetical protein